MSMPQQSSSKVDNPDYSETLPPNKTQIFDLLKNYSHIPPAEIEPHLRAIRDRAWAAYPYGCIGRWLFLDCVITALPEYPSLISRLQAGQVLLDAGCCFGYALRQLAFDGAPAQNLIGTDLLPEFLDLGHDLFKDKDRFEAKFIAADLLNVDDHALDAVDGTVDIIFAAGLFHLFGWDDQVVLGTRLVHLLRQNAEDAMIVGRQIGTMAPLSREEHAAQGPTWYRHNLVTWQQLWDEIGEKTNTQWKVSGTLTPMSHTATPGPRAGLDFAIHKVN